MKKRLQILLCVFTVFSFGLKANAQEENNFWEEFFGDVLENYSDAEYSRIEEKAKADDQLIENLAQGYLDVVEPIAKYGTGLSEYKYTLPSDEETKIGFCQGWRANFFYMTKRGKNSFTEYIKLWEVGSAKIVTQNGYKYIVIYPVEGMSFEKRGWYGEDSATDYSETESIKFYMDWSKAEAGVIDRMVKGLNVWGKMNTEVRKAR